MIKSISRVWWIIAGPIFLLFSVWGLFAFLGIGFDSLTAVVLDIFLIAPFPIYLLALRSTRLAVLVLWIYFAFEWLFRSYGLGPEKGLMNPFSGDMLYMFVLIVLCTVASLHCLCLRNEPPPRKTET